MKSIFSKALFSLTMLAVVSSSCIYSKMSVKKYDELLAKNDLEAIFDDVYTHYSEKESSEGNKTKVKAWIDRAVKSGKLVFSLLKFKIAIDESLEKSKPEEAVALKDIFLAHYSSELLFFFDVTDERYIERFNFMKNLLNSKIVDSLAKKDVQKNAATKALQFFKELDSSYDATYLDSRWSLQLLKNESWTDFHRFRRHYIFVDFNKDIEPIELTRDAGIVKAHRSFVIERYFINLLGEDLYKRVSAEALIDSSSEVATEVTEDNE